jgi:hypothetical protein
MLFTILLNQRRKTSHDVLIDGEKAFVEIKYPSTLAK